ncbi:aspartate carbamoyltransferase [Candidatus Wirthbacteria bacterium CG2_30_54_11]|uniref:Aspartate carbamoyltransferase n=1 Tax=Candidatus Wirthbacteria bacterium CG2_30_54_11 TaxID=1817892 RepID=A0A1J5IDB7_9BACT|nr:MAG: aspartate carbamoyltransferase [Candidatus Wirthbacteria bacterium CG2_30_54_11]
MHDFKGRDIISIEDFDREDLMYVMKTAELMETNDYSDLLKGMIIATLFFEPSTRTRFSFETAALKLGAQVITTSSAQFSSLYKGETLFDTAAVIGGYADVLVMRHPEKGSAHALAAGTDKPVINGGDGPGEHPSQTLLDLYTIMTEKGTLDSLHIGFVGDLKNGRTVHSLVTALKFFNPTLYFIAPKALAIPEEYKKMLDDAAITYHVTESLDEYLDKIDVLYVTRIQKERFSDPAEYEKLKHVYVIDRNTLSQAKPDISIMHPLPRVGEIKEEIDDTKNAVYFRQAWNGVPVRMALLALVTGKFVLKDERTLHRLVKKNVLVSIGTDEDKKTLLPEIQHMHQLGYNIYATDKTSKFLAASGVPNTRLHKISDKASKPNIKDFLAEKRLDMIINIPTGKGGAEDTDGALMRKMAIGQQIPLFTELQVVRFLMQALD